MTPNLIRSVAAACLAAALMPAQEEHEVIVLPKGKYSVTKGSADAKSRTKLITIVEQLSDESTPPAERKKLKRALLKLLGDADVQAKGVGVVEVQDVPAEAKAGGIRWRVSTGTEPSIDLAEVAEKSRGFFEVQDPVKGVEVAKESKGNALRLRAQELRAQLAKPGTGHGEGADEVAVVVESNGSEEPHIRYLDVAEARSIASKARADAAAARAEAMQAHDQAMKAHAESMKVHERVLLNQLLKQQDASAEAATARIYDERGPHGIQSQEPKKVGKTRETRTLFRVNRDGKAVELKPGEMKTLRVGEDEDTQERVRLLLRNAEAKGQAAEVDGFSFWSGKEEAQGDDGKEGAKVLRWALKKGDAKSGDAKAGDHAVPLARMLNGFEWKGDKKGNVFYLDNNERIVFEASPSTDVVVEECEECEVSDHNDGEVLEMIEAMRDEMRELRTMIEEIRNSLRGNRAGPMVTRDRPARLAPAAVRKEDATPPRLERVREVRSIK